MRVCLMIEGQEGVSWPQWLALARAAEGAGLDGLFRSDHYSSLSGERQALDAWTTLSGLAVATDRLRLGTLVSPVTFRHPSLLARAVATVDHISGGRVELGMGAGWMELEHERYGFRFPPAAERGELLAEQVEIVVRQWTEERFDFSGRFYELRDCRALPKPLQQPHPPLILGGEGKRRALALAARFADEYNSPFKGPEFVRELRRALDEACAAAGRSGRVRASVMAGLVLGRDEHEVEDRARRLMERIDHPGEPRGFLESAGEGVIAGTPEQIVERLRRLSQEGADGIYLQHLVHDDLEPIELLGREVVPELR